MRKIETRERSLGLISLLCLASVGLTGCHGSSGKSANDSKSSSTSALTAANSTDSAGFIQFSMPTAQAVAQSAASVSGVARGTRVRLGAGNSVNPSVRARTRAAPIASPVFQGGVRKSDIIFTPTLDIRSAADYNEALTPNTIGAAWSAADLSTATDAYVQVSNDRGGYETYRAYLIYVGPNQVNFILPDLDIPSDNLASLLVAKAIPGNSYQLLARSDFRLYSAIPGIFTANDSGAGAYNGFVVYTYTNEGKPAQDIYSSYYGTYPNRLPVAIAALPGESVSLVLYATGAVPVPYANQTCVSNGRHRAYLETKYGWVEAKVDYYGNLPESLGLAQINVDITDFVQRREFTEGAENRIYIQSNDCDGGDVASNQATFRVAYFY